MKRPNILLLMCDQLTPGALGCYGGAVPTPHLDRLAAEGVLFTGATCPTPFCSPSRASLLTSAYPRAHGIVHNVNRRDYPAIPAPSTEEGIRAGDVTTDHLLCAAGWETHHFGKWHLMDDDLPYYPDMYREHQEYAEEMAGTFADVRARPPEEWMEWYGWALPVETSPALRAAVAALGDRWQGLPYARFITQMGRLALPVERTFDARVADQTIQCLAARRNAPFSITCSFNYPHDPNVVPSPYYDSVDPDALPLPANWNVREARFERDWSRRIVADLGEAGAREFLRIYYASVRLVDDQVGRILAALDASGQAEETVVVFTADHGDMAGGHGMVWKSTGAFYDEVVRVPLIFRYPTAVAPGRLDAAAGLTDLMPTLLDLAGREIPEGVQGESLAPLLRGAGGGPRYSFCERVAANREHTRRVALGAPGSFMVRGEGWKYIRYGTREEYLYHLDEDPGETRNLAGDPAHATRRDELAREMDAWLARTGYRGAG